MMYAIQCIQSTVRLVPIKLYGSYPLPIVQSVLSQSQRMSSTHTHKQLVSRPEKQQQQQQQTQPKHEQQFALNHSHVSIFGTEYPNEVSSNWIGLSVYMCMLYDCVNSTILFCLFCHSTQRICIEIIIRYMHCLHINSFVFAPLLSIPFHCFPFIVYFWI